MPSHRFRSPISVFHELTLAAVDCRSVVRGLMNIRWPAAGGPQHTDRWRDRRPGASPEGSGPHYSRRSPPNTYNTVANTMETTRLLAILGIMEAYSILSSTHLYKS